VDELSDAVPRPPDGKQNLSAPELRTRDSKPDLSWTWGWETPANCDDTL